MRDIALTDIATIACRTCLSYGAHTRVSVTLKYDAHLFVDILRANVARGLWLRAGVDCRLPTAAFE